MEKYEKSLFFIGFISTRGERLEVDEVWYNHTKLAERIVADDPLLQQKMAKSRHFIAIDFLICDMGYLKIGNRNKKEILYSLNKKPARVIKDYIMLYEALGYSIIKI